MLSQLSNCQVHITTKCIPLFYKIKWSALQIWLNQVDRNDGQFFKAMEWRWLFFSNDGMAMVFENSHHNHRWFLAGSTNGSDGFSMVFQFWGPMVYNGFWKGARTITIDGMVPAQPSGPMVFWWFLCQPTIGKQCFSMVANHWSNDAMVTTHRSGLWPCLIYQRWTTRWIWFRQKRSVKIDFHSPGS